MSGIFNFYPFSPLTTNPSLHSAAKTTLVSIIIVNLAIYCSWKIQGLTQRKKHELFDSDEDDSIEEENDPPTFMENHFTISALGIYKYHRYHTLLTPCISHSSFSHLTNNMTALWLFAYPLHLLIGRYPLLATYILGGIASNISFITFSSYQASIPYLIDQSKERNTPSALGASGSISTIITLFSILKPLHIINLGNIHTPALLYALIFFTIESFSSFHDISHKLTSLLTLTRSSSSEEQYASDGIAHTAHWAGSLVGLLIGCWLRYYYKRPLPWRSVIKLFVRYQDTAMQLIEMMTAT